MGGGQLPVNTITIISKKNLPVITITEKMKTRLPVLPERKDFSTVNKPWSLSYAKQNDSAQNLKKVFVREIRKIGTFSALYLDSHVFFQNKNYKANIPSIMKRIIR